MSATCRSCGAPIRWEKTTNGRPIPLDPLPVEDGNLALRNDGRVASFIEGAWPADAERFVTHFATCPTRRLTGRGERRS